MGAYGHPPGRARRSRGDRTKGDGLKRLVEPHEEFAPNPYNSHSWIVGAPDIGEGTWIGAFTVIDGSGGLTIGRGCDISSGVHIYTHSSARRCVTAREHQTVDRAPVVIGDRVFIGANAVVMMGVTIGSGSIVAAGAVVTHDVPAASVVAGTPARVIGVVEPDGRTRIDGSGYAPI